MLVVVKWGSVVMMEMGVVELVGFPWSVPHEAVQLCPTCGLCPSWRQDAVGLDSLFLLTSSEHSLLGNEMQIDRKDNEPACGRWGSL